MVSMGTIKPGVKIYIPANKPIETEREYYSRRGVQLNHNGRRAIKIQKVYKEKKRTFKIKNK